jgi:predicted DsbA family dithiol-disulfide isomerase
VTSKNEIRNNNLEMLPSAATKAAVIEVVSDVVCPWCLIGKRRLEKAIALLSREDVQIRWRPFELNPDAPKEGYDRQAYRARKFGSKEYAQQLEARVAQAGAEDGIHFRFDRITRVPNTFDAHRLLWLAGPQGLQNALAENLFRAYFIDAQDVGDRKVLAGIGRQIGMDPAGVDELLGGDLGSDEVRADERQARARGVSGVPSFFIGGVPITSGAQHPELLAAVLGPALDSTAGQCAPDDGACS